mgnify:CR=1 FL=1
MITLEEQINMILAFSNAADIEDQKWRGRPMDGLMGIPIMNEQQRVQMHDFIERAPLEVCLTSPSEYIREYRKWYEENRNVRG